MSEVSPIQDGVAGGSVTTVVRAHIKPGKEDEYEQWLHGISGCTGSMRSAADLAGFKGPPCSGPMTSLTLTRNT